MLQAVRSRFEFPRRRLALTGLIVAMVLLAGWTGSAQPHNGLSKAKRHATRLIIDHLEEQWRDAVLSNNTAKMNSLLADDFMAITPFGTLQNKDQTLTSLRSGHWHFTTLKMSDRKVRFYGRTALVTSEAEVQASTPEGELSGNFFYTRVYARDAHGNWKIVNFEANRIDGPQIPKVLKGDKDGH